MKKALSILLSLPAYSWAVVMMLLIPVMFVGLSTFTHELARFSFMKIHPRYSGGEIAYEYAENEIKFIIHEPVFKWLIKDKNNGILQIEIVTPKTILEKTSIDINGDSTPDILIDISEDKGLKITPFTKDISGLQIWSKTKTGWLLRLSIKKGGMFG
jgi:hypothetical protein